MAAADGGDSGGAGGAAEGAAGGGGEASSEEAAAAASIEADILSSPVFLRRKLEVVQKELEATNAEIEEARGRLDQAKEEWQPQLDELEREYARIQSRMSDQGAGSDAAATVQVVRQVLGVLDTFERAFGSVRASTDEEREVERQYREVADLILETFEKLGVEAVETVGKEFDYEVHQAVLQRPSDRYEEGIVCEELQKGFKLGDQLVRAAMVAVAA
jgi:molecular chaperone GrpE